MKKALHILVIVTLLASCSREYGVEDELYLCLTKEFSKHSLDLKKTMDTLEILYISEGLIDSRIGADYRQYYQTNIDTGMVLILQDAYLNDIATRLELSQSKLDSCILNKFDKETYDSSKFGRISNMIDSMVTTTGQIASSTVATAHLNILSAKDFEHPYYRASVLLSLQFLYFNKYLNDDHKYIKQIPKKI